MTYVRIRSWHVVKGSGGELVKTRCGRWADRDAETLDFLPAEKSCETCLRLVAREVDGWVSG